MSLRAIPLRVRLPVAPIHILLAGQFDSFTVAIQFSVGYIGLSFRYTDTGNREMNFCDGRREEKCIVWQERCRYVMSTCLFFILHSFSWPYPLFFFRLCTNFFLPARPWFGYLSVLHNANQQNRFNHSRLICYPPPICVCRWMFRLWKCTNKLPMRSLTI